MNMFSGQLWTWSPTDDFYKIYVAFAKDTFFIAPAKSNESFNLTSSLLMPSLIESDFSLTDAALVALQFIILLWSSLRVSFAAFTFYLNCFTIGVASKNMLKNFGSGHDMSIHQITAAFQALKKLTDSVNSTWDQLCIWFIIDIIVYTAIDLDVTFRFINWIPKLMLGYYIICIVAALFLSAEADRKVLCSI